MTMTTIRSIAIASGTDTRIVEILHDERGFWLHDTADANHDALTQIEDDSDTAVQDALTGDWQIVEAIDAYWFNGTSYCPECVEGDTPCLGDEEIARATRSPGQGQCGCCHAAF